MPKRLEPRVRRGIGTLMGLFCLCAPSWAKFSLGVRFPDIVMENVPPGAVVNLRQLKGVPYVVINQSTELTVDVLVEPEAPVLGPAQAKEGYVPVPSAEWLKVVPNRFRLGPGDAASSEIILTVPDDQGLVGKHFQVNIKARTEGVGNLALAVNSYVRFSVGTAGPAALKKEKNRRALDNVDLEISPPNLRLQNVPLGKALSIKAFKGTSLKVINKGETPVKLKATAGKAESGHQDPGWEAPDPSWLGIKPELLTVKANQIREAQLFLTIPDRPEHRGRRYLFLVSLELADLGIPLQFATRVYVETESLDSVPASRHGAEGAEGTKGTEGDKKE